MKSISKALAERPLIVSRIIHLIEEAAAKEPMNWTDLLCLVCESQPPIDLVRYIVDQDPTCPGRPNSQGFPIYTALYYACGNKASLEVVRYLAARTPEDSRYVEWAWRNSAPLEVLQFLFRDYSAGRAMNQQVLIHSGLPLETVKWLTEEFPQAAQGWINKCTRGISLEVVQYLNETFPKELYFIGSGRWLIERACSYGCAPIEVCQYLIQCYPQTLPIGERDKTTVLHGACEYGRPLGVIRALVEAYPDALKLDGTGTRYDEDGGRDYCQGLPLHCICSSRYCKIREQYKCERDWNCRNRVHICNCCRVDAATLLYMVEQYPPAVRKKSRSSVRLPLHLLCANSPSLEAVKVLVNAYPESVYIKDNKGKLPIEVAAHCASPDVLLFLFKQPNQPRAYQQCLSLDLCLWSLRRQPGSDGIEVVRLILEQKYRVHSKSPGVLPFHAILSNEISSVSATNVGLLGELFRAEEKDEDASALLRIACTNGASTRLFRTLGGPFPRDHTRVPDNQGMLPLHVACSNPHRNRNVWKHVLCLVKWDPPSVGMVDNEGRLPLHLACSHNAPFEVIRFLLERLPESAETRDGRGLLPFLHAGLNSPEESNLECIYFLLRRNPDLTLCSC